MESSKRGRTTSQKGIAGDPWLALGAAGAHWQLYSPYAVLGHSSRVERSVCGQSQGSRGHACSSKAERTLALLAAGEQGLFLGKHQSTDQESNDHMSPRSNHLRSKTCRSPELALKTAAQKSLKFGTVLPHPKVSRAQV